MKNLVENKGLCCGCTACQSICPKNAISMKEDAEGFLYPHIEESACIDCGLCASVCPIGKNKTPFDGQKAYAARVDDIKQNAKSQSGGMFFAAATWMLKQNGSVYGVALCGSEMQVEYIRVTNQKDAKQLRGSKYVQASVGTVFLQVKRDLKQGKKVLFSGTPCHVAGLYSFLECAKVSTENLYSMDLICHGTPSPLHYRDYLVLLSDLMGQEITFFDFRAKVKQKWGGHMILFKTKKQAYITRGLVELFYTNLELRPSCYQCTFSYQNRFSDITIGDYWGIQEEHPNFEVKAGVSAVITNSEKGQKLFDAIKDTLCIEESSVEKMVKRNQNLFSPTPQPSNRAEFWEDYYTNGFSSALEKYVPCEGRKIITLKEFIDANGLSSSPWKRIKDGLRIRTRIKRIFKK